jgi:hypothetical protein
MIASRPRALVVCASLCSARSALAGQAEAVPGVSRPDWIIWATLGALLLFFVGILLATQGGWRGKGRDKKDRLTPPYF